MTRPIAGADGCKGGWILVRAEDLGTPVSHRICANASAIVRATAPDAVVAIDIPIGLRADPERSADRLARAAIGRRASSVFPVPVRSTLGAASYDEAKERSFARIGKKLSLQAWHILPRIRDVDWTLRRDAAAAQRIHEVHPEVSFTMLNGGTPMGHAKKRREGRAERLALIEGIFPGAFASIRDAYRATEVASDDILDALVAMWSAARIRDGIARAFPEGEPPRDAFGLPMVIRA